MVCSPVAARAVLAAVVGWLGWVGSLHADRTLVDFGPGFPVKSVTTQDATVSVIAEAGSLQVCTGHTTPWPGVTFQPAAGTWDLAAFQDVTLELRNPGSTRLEVQCRLDSPGPNGQRWSIQDKIALAGGEKRPLKVALSRRLPAELSGKLFGMRGYPGGVREDSGIDPAKVDRLIVFVAKPKEDFRFEIHSIRATGNADDLGALPANGKSLFPMIDRFGQYIHKDWPGKTRSDDDLKNRRQQEATELASHPGPADWDPYGGWKAGPQLPPTGHFYTQKYQGKWWLVDPEGRLFWSHGVDCVRPNAETPITDRRHWFAELPATGSRFLGHGRWAPHGYYQGKSYETYDILGANLARKYGPQFEEPYGAVVHSRLRSWSLNTIGNWSDRRIVRRGKTPYVATISSGGAMLEGSTGYWGKFRDVFDPSFAAAVRKSMESERGGSAGDARCLGYFVDNELGWGDDVSLALATLTSPATQAAKRVFLDDLKAKFKTVEQLNQAWGTHHASWTALAESQTPPDRKKAQDELAAFYTKFAEQYFHVCREAVKAVAPQQLYLGCRFAWVNDRAVRAASRYCDVLSFNVYRRTLAEHRLPEGVDLPVLIGEFHFGALDRGMFHTGLVKTASQAERAETYRQYVLSGLRSPHIVGTHWFQFTDQATTGRGDGENYQIGLVDICDTPYTETVEAVRRVGESMYGERLR